MVELKPGKFKPEYKGQVEFYLNYLEKYEMNEGENPPIDREKTGRIKSIQPLVQNRGGIGLGLDGVKGIALIAILKFI